MTDAWTTLGVPRGADEAEIRKAWRRRALALRGGLDDADEFRRVRAAYEELTGAGPAAPEPATVAGADLTGLFDVPFEVWAVGGRVRVVLEFPRFGRRVLAVDVPADVRPGWSRRVAGAGGPGSPPGDLVVQVRHVLEDPAWRVDGVDLRRTIEVSLADIVEGRVLEVNAPTGRHRVPVGRSLAPVRLPRQGLRRGGRVGDLVVDLEVRWPRPTPALLRELRAAG